MYTTGTPAAANAFLLYGWDSSKKSVLRVTWMRGSSIMRSIQAV